MEKFTTRDEIIETVNKLFIYTDQQEWGKLQKEVFTDKVAFDMSSLGGERSELTVTAICEMWKTGFAGIDAVNHLAGNYLVQQENTTANVFAYATATHYKASAVKGTIREFVGTYDIGLVRVPGGWRINKFTYNLKYTNGNMTLE